MKGLPLLSRFFKLLLLFCCDDIPIWKFNILSVSANEPGIKSYISGVMLQVAPESKIQLVVVKLYPKYLLEISTLEVIGDIDVYTLCDLLWSVLLSGVLTIFVDLCALVLGFSGIQWTFFFEVFVLEHLQ